MFNFFGYDNKPPQRRNSVTESTDSTGSVPQQQQIKPTSRPTDAVGVDRLLYGHNTHGRSARPSDSNHEPVKGGLTPAKAVSQPPPQQSLRAPQVIGAQTQQQQPPRDWSIYNQDVTESL